MDKNYFLIAKWIADYLGGKENSEDQDELENWRKEPVNEALLRRIEKDSGLRMAGKRYDDFSEQEGWEQLQAKRIRLRQRVVLRRVGACAALIMLFLGTALLFWMQVGDKKNDAIELVQNGDTGDQGIRLILDDGKAIDLKKQQGVIPDSLALIRNVGNCLTYQIDSLAVKNAPVFHELVVPVCGEYQLQLSDGTEVYLNAQTKLRFPSYFEGESREVVLEGEAYFKVAKNPDRPFVVRCAHSVVYVYGTQFNLSAYPDESETHTTLVEGKLAVEHSGVQREIQPGERWCYHQKTGKVTVETVDVTLYTAWKDGRLRFNDARLEDIMRTVARWYGVEVSYQCEELKDLRFGCNVNRDRSIEPLLRVFEANGKIKIERENNHLKIKRGR